MNEDNNFNEVDNYISGINSGQDNYRDPNYTYVELTPEQRANIDYVNNQTNNDNDFMVAKAFYNGAVNSLERGVLGLLKGVRDTTVAKNRERDPKYQPLDISYTFDRALASEHLKPYKVKAGTKLGRFGLNLASGAGQLVRQMALGVATGGTGNLALMGAEIAGNQYLELNEKGVAPERAMYASFANAAIQAPMERLSLGKLLKMVPKGSPIRQQIAQVIEKSTTEGLTEFLQQYPEEITKMVALNENMTDEQLLELSKQNVGKWTENAIEAGVIGSILGGTVGGVQMGFQRMAHQNQTEALKRSADYARKAGVDSQTIANVTNANTNGMSVDIDAETLLGYMQEHEDASDILGMTVEDVQQAAEAGASVDILVGNVQAMEAKHGDFLQTVSDDMAFNDGGYTPSNERIQREMKKAYAQQAQTENELNTQMNELYDQMIEAGVPKSIAAVAIQLYTATAKAYRPYDPAAYFREHPLTFKDGQVVDGFIADLLENAKGLDGVDNHVVKGSIGWDGNQAVISFYKSGDSSTVIHESGHFFVENLANDVNSGKATEQEVKDWNTLLEYAGMTNEQWLAADVEGRRAAHEKLAEAFETYLMEGKAPSMELRNVFKRFSTWLKNVYSTIARNENAAPINDDVRKVFDRMLAAEEDIAEMERVNGYFAKLPSVITDNMSDSTKKRLEDVIQKAHDKAVEMLTREAMVNFTPERRAKIEAYKESIRADVEEQVHQRPLYTASEHIVEAIGEGRGTAKSWSKKYLNANGKEFDTWQEEKAEVDSTIASILDPIIEVLKEGAGASEKTNYKVNPDTNEAFYEGMEGYDGIDESYGAKNQVMHEGRQDWYQEYTQGRKLSNKAYEEWARAIASGEDVPAPMDYKMSGMEASKYYAEQKAELDRLFERREELQKYAEGKKAAYNSKLANSLADAMMLEEKGVAKSKIKKLTGWDKSDGVWKYQLPEGEFHYDKLPAGGESVKLKDVYDNADLYKLMPELKNIELDVVAELDNGARFEVEHRGDSTYFKVAKNVAEGTDNKLQDLIVQVAEVARGKEIDPKAPQVKMGDFVLTNYDENATAWRFTGMKEDMRMVYDIIAEEMGYSSGDEMAKAIMEAPTERVAVNQEIDARAKAQFPDINEDRQTAMDAAREALYNDDSGLVIGVEQTIIEDAAAGMLAKQRSAEAKRALAMAKKQAAETAARADIAKMSIKDAIRVKKYIAAERSAAQKAAVAMAKKDYQKALMYKDMQAYQHALVRESVKAKLVYDRGLKLVKKQVRAKRDTWYKEEHFVQAAGLLSRMGLNRKDYDPALKVQSLADYMAAMQEEFDCVDIADWLVDEGTYIPAPLDLTLDQFNDVVDALRNIKAIARADKGVNMFNSAADWAETRGQIMERLGQMPTRWEADVNKNSEPSLLERQDASLLNLDTFFERLDGWKQGVFSKLFGESIVKANDKEASMMWDYQERVADAFKRWLPDKAAEAEANTEKYYEELGTSVDRHVLVRMLMNLGNRSGSDKLCAVAPDSTFAAFFPKSTLWVEGDVDVTRQNLLEFLGNVLDESDVRYAQEMLDASGMYWNELAALEKRTKGFSPVKVDPLPAILSMHGKSVVFKGGYLPLIRRRDTGSRPMSADALPATDSNRGAGIRTLHTNTGSTKHRDSSVYPIDLRRGVEFNAVQDSIHDICWRELMNDFRRAVNDRELYNEMKTKFGAAYFDVFTEMLKKSAQPYDPGNSFVSERESARCLNWFRAKTVNVAIMLNFKVALQNLANPLLYGRTVEGFGYADALHAMGNMFSNYNKAGDYVSAKDFVFAKSIFMKERSVLPDVTLRDVKSQEAVKLSKLENMGIEWGAKLMAYTDNISAVPVWMEAYNKKLKSGATEQDAILFADTVIRRTLGSSRANEVAAVQRGGPLQKLLTTFMSFFNTQFNQWRREAGIAHDLYTTGAKGEAVRRLMAFAAAKYLTFCMMNLMLALENPFEDDDDGYMKLTKELLHYPISMLGWQGGVANAVLSNAIGERTYGYRLTSTEGTIERMITLAGKVGNVARGKSDVSSLAEPATSVAGMALGVPSQFNKLCWNAYDILANDMDFEVRDLIVRRPRSERKEK